VAAVRDLAAASGRYPHMARWLAQPAGPTVDEQFDLGHSFLLDGIATRLRGGPPGGPPGRPGPAS